MKEEITKEKEVHVSITNDILTVKGERSQQQEVIKLPKAEAVKPKEIKIDVL